MMAADAESGSQTLLLHMLLIPVGASNAKEHISITAKEVELCLRGMICL